MINPKPVASGGSMITEEEKASREAAALEARKVAYLKAQVGKTLLIAGNPAHDTLRKDQRFNLIYLNDGAGNSVGPLIDLQGWLELGIAKATLEKMHGPDYDDLSKMVQWCRENDLEHVHQNAVKAFYSWYNQPMAFQQIPEGGIPVVKKTVADYLAFKDQK